MSTIALEIGPGGYSWCWEPEVIQLDDLTAVTEHNRPWPKEPYPLAKGLPLDFSERILAHQEILGLVNEADDILYAVHPETDLRLAGAIDMAVSNFGWSPVRIVDPHPNGAAGIMQGFIAATLEAAEPVPQEDEIDMLEEGTRLVKESRDERRKP